MVWRRQGTRCSCRCFPCPRGDRPDGDDGVLLQIESRKGTRAIMTNAEEHEVLTMPGQRLRAEASAGTSHGPPVAKPGGGCRGRAILLEVVGN